MLSKSSVYNIIIFAISKYNKEIFIFENGK